MIETEQLRVWLEALDLVVDMPWTIGPYNPDFGNQDRQGFIQEVPGSGLQREGTFEQVSYQIAMREHQAYQADLEKAAKQVDDALLAVSNETIWGEYVTYVDRFGTRYPSYDAIGERVTFIINYVIEMGR